MDISSWKQKEAYVFSQAEDGIRDSPVTGVQTCALPIFISTNTIPRNTSKVDVSGVIADSIR